MDLRFQLATRYAAKLFAAGEIVYSPITMGHPINEELDEPGTWEQWERFDRAYLSLSHRMVVLCLPGWEESMGVQAEIRIARELGIPIDYEEVVR